MGENANTISGRSPSRIEIILRTIESMYPDADIALLYDNPWELLVAVMLSAQCTDTMVNKVTRTLFRKYRTVNDYATADTGMFEQDIRSTGFFRNKARHIIGTAKILHRSYGDKVPETMTDLVALPGVARKTANVVLSTAYGKLEGIVVDTHVLRISQRLRLIDIHESGGRKARYVGSGSSDRIDYFADADPDKIERMLMDVLPKEIWKTFSFQVIEHGRRVCSAKSPSCSECHLRRFCPSKRA
jgi:endonuclease-3